MMTLREFVEKVNSHEHFRVYQPNRDCLIYESYFKIHSSYDFRCVERNQYQHGYYEDNDYCNDVLKTKELDEETKVFLDKFGDYEVFRMECSGFSPSRMFKDETGTLRIEHVKEESRPVEEYLECFNLFIK